MKTFSPQVFRAEFEFVAFDGGPGTGTVETFAQFVSGEFSAERTDLLRQYARYLELEVACCIGSDPRFETDATTRELCQAAMYTAASGGCDALMTKWCQGDRSADPRCGCMPSAPFDATTDMGLVYSRMKALGLDQDKICILPECDSGSAYKRAQDTTRNCSTLCVNVANVNSHGGIQAGGKTTQIVKCDSKSGAITLVDCKHGSVVDGACSSSSPSTPPPPSGTPTPPPPSGPPPSGPPPSSKSPGASNSHSIGVGGTIALIVICVAAGFCVTALIIHRRRHHGRNHESR